MAKSNRLNRIVKTADGSHTIYVPELDEHYHSINGAVQESEHIFIKSGLATSKADPVNIFEAGFGTGLNALLTARYSIRENKKINYTAIEKFPIDEDVYMQLNHLNFAGKEGAKLSRLIHSAPWDISVEIIPGFNLFKIKGDLTTLKLSGEYDLIYFDAFGPDKQPEMWTPAVFKSIASITINKGIFVTYSAKGTVKRNLQECGFDVQLLQGPPGKRQIIRAVKK
jgi:tRNA U34 5-methylaminomethyl-2-thiouridine-forming methyltransferase MnmC